MGNVLSDSFHTYRSNLKLVLLFSIPFIIASLIPLFAPFPTYISAGAIFLRNSSIFLNLNFISLAVIIAAFFLSLLFISFAFVAINLIVKSKRTHTKASSRVLKGIEKYTVNVLIVLLIYSIVLSIASVLGYMAGIQALITGIVGFFGFVFVFYAPSAIVMEDKKIIRSMIDSVRLVVSAPQYFLLWLVLLVVIISLLDSVFIITVAQISRYIMLVITSLFILPYFVILMTESYMKKFPILRH